MHILQIAILVKQCADQHFSYIHRSYRLILIFQPHSLCKVDFDWSSQQGLHLLNPAIQGQLLKLQDS